MSEAPTSTTNDAATARTLAMALIGSTVFIVIATSYVLAGSGDGLATPPIAILVGLVVAGVAVHLLLEKIGYAAGGALDRHLEPDEATRKAFAVWQPSMVLRFVLSEFLAIIAVVLGFVLPRGGVLVIVVGGIVSLLLMLVHVWPGARPVGKVADNLERDGQPSGLREAFGHASTGMGSSGGAIQEL